MAEPGASPPRASKQLNLHGGVGDVVLASNHVRDAELEIVGHRRKRIEKASVLPPQHRVGERTAIDVAVAAHKVSPADSSRIEAKPPVRPAAGGFERRALGVGQAERRAVVDRAAD